MHLACVMIAAPPLMICHSTPCVSMFIKLKEDSCTSSTLSRVLVLTAKDSLNCTSDVLIDGPWG